MSEFETNLIKQIAIESVKSPAVVKAIDDKIYLNDEMLEHIVRGLEPEKMAELIARNVVALGWSGRVGRTSAIPTVYSEVMKKAQERSIDIVAEQISKDAMGIR